MLALLSLLKVKKTLELIPRMINFHVFKVVYMILLSFFCSSTWDEHLFEIVLPRPCCVGHVDIKFTLHPMCTSPPDVQITLLKQNATTLGRQSNTSHTAEVDKSIDFNINASTRSQEENTNSSCPDKPNGRVTEGINSVLDPDFLEDHNAEILCGPVNLASFLDLSGNSGLITLTSPQLLTTKPKAFLIHVKGFHSKNDDKNNEKQRVCTSICSKFHIYNLL